MTDSYDIYANPLVDRYASRLMAGLFSPRRKFTTWRRLWIALAEAEKELGLEISDQQIEELKSQVNTIDFAAAEAHERRLRHDVMAHIHAYRDVCPSGGAILHLGATSCYVTDNTDLLLMREGLEIILHRLRDVMRRLAAFARRHAALPTLGYTHFQPAQFTTVGKRAALWLQDFALDHEELETTLHSLRFRGVKGTTGTQDSFLKLFGGDSERVEELDRRVSEKMGFSRRFLVTGQTYTRKLDHRVVASLSALAQSAHKFTNDLRLLCHLREVEEPFEDKQIGSSAMPYKRNPMRSERVASLSRFLISMAENTAYTEATQWLERTLDDSANRRLSIPQAFMAADAILILCENISSGLIVREAVIRRNLREHLPFIASEEILMKAVQFGGDRQHLHELIRTHALAAAEAAKTGADGSDFLERLLVEPEFRKCTNEVQSVLDPSRFTGRAAEQVEAFLRLEVEPLLSRFPADTRLDGEVRV